MNFKRGFPKLTTEPAPRQGAATSVELFSFKQLEDKDVEDHITFTGQKEKTSADFHKIDNKGHERTSSVSSISSVSSAGVEIKSSENLSAEGITEITKIPGKLPETAGSSIKNAARATLESSKDLFSGLKGKITDKISKTIEEFSGDSSSSLSQEKEKIKLLLLHKNSNKKSTEKEIDSVCNSVASNIESVLSALNKEDVNSQDLDDRGCLSLDNSESTLPLKDTSESLSEEDMPAQSVLKKSTLFPEKENVEAPSLAKSNIGENFEDVIEPRKVELLSRTRQNNSDISEFYNPHREVSEAEVQMLTECLSRETTENVTSSTGFWATIQQKSTSKMKQFMRRSEPKSLTCTTLSNLHNTHSEQFASSLEGNCSELSNEENISTECKESGESEQISSKVKDKTSSDSFQSTSISSRPVKKVISQLSLENLSLPYQKLITATIFLFSYFIIPMPAYISGLIMGVMLASLGWAAYMKLMEQPQVPDPLKLTLVDELPPVPEMRVTTKGQEFLHKGWMNELTDYNPDDYHINKTHSVFVSLEGSHLRLQRPKNSVPKRAMWDEMLPKPQFIHQRHFDLPGSKVFLQPHGLVKKRIWSKKYPICIVIANKISNEDVKMKSVTSEPNMSERKVSDMGFEFVTEDRCDLNVLYLFARTSREKEDWFKRFAAAAYDKPLGNHVLEIRRILSQSSTLSKKYSKTTHKRVGSIDSVASDSPSELSSQKEKESLELLSFAHYMGRLIPSGLPSGASSPSHSKTNKEAVKNSDTEESVRFEETRTLNPGPDIFYDDQLFWINALIGRCFFDFLQDKWWSGNVKEKLQRKFSKIHVPYFMEELQVTDINMGCEVPSIRHAGKPYIDERGFWVNLDITYAGGFNMTIETKMNLMRLKKSPDTSPHTGQSVSRLKSPITDSDEEDSAESTTDEEEDVPSHGEDSSPGGGTSKKFLHYFNKITQSKYFQQATEYKVIKRAMENVSNTPLILSVTVISLVGKLALNIPPPPSDRLWYGFRGNPHLRLSAKPQVGERVVTITHIVEWIEKKLATEFQRVFVMPNMDDLIIPILVPGETASPAIPRSASL